MASLTQDRNTPRRAGAGLALSAPLAANAVIFAGGMFTLNANGEAKASVAADKTPVFAVSIVRARQAEGAQLAQGERGAFRFENAAGAGAITRADVGKNAFVADDQTVAKAGSSIVGEILDIDDAGVWVAVASAATPATA